MTVSVSCVTHILMRPPRLFLFSVRFWLNYVAVNNNFVANFFKVVRIAKFHQIAFS